MELFPGKDRLEHTECISTERFVATDGANATSVSAGLCAASPLGAFDKLTYAATPQGLGWGLSPPESGFGECRPTHIPG